MFRSHVPACLLAVPVAIACIGLAAPAAAAPVHKAARSCSTSATPTANKYTRTPAGSGPWHVPLDPCNYEARANGWSSMDYTDCVYWPAEKRPDVFYGPVNKYGYKQAPYGAWNVAIDAKKYGYSVNHSPKVGDIAAWKSNAMMGQSPGDTTWYQSSPGGHLAYVEAVHGGVITISETGHGSDDGGYTFDLSYTSTAYFIHRP